MNIFSSLEFHDVFRFENTAFWISEMSPCVTPWYKVIWLACDQALSRSRAERGRAVKRAGPSKKVWCSRLGSAKKPFQNCGKCWGRRLTRRIGRIVFTGHYSRRFWFERGKIFFRCSRHIADVNVTNIFPLFLIGSLLMMTFLVQDFAIQAISTEKVISHDFLFFFTFCLYSVNKAKELI